MLNQYQNEIIALIIILTILVIYLIIKIRTKKSQNKDTTNLHNRDEEIPQVVAEEIATTKKEIKEESLEIDPTGSEEGDFGEEDFSNETSSNTIKPTHIIEKRDVPSHPKITKQNFTEFSGERILVAEDNLINQKVLTGLLAGSGIEVVIANDGQEALDILESDSDFLMVLMDAHMPRVDGFEATRAIRKEEKYNHILVVALSGDVAPDDIKKMREVGMAEQLEKPLRMEALYDIFYAYTGKEKSANNDDNEFLEVPMTQELNGVAGLEVCGGDEEFYREILSEFVQTYENSTQELEELLQNKKLAKADKLLLDLIGITANIGAKSLNTIATDIKDALRDTQNRSYLTLTDKYKVHLENLIKDIKEYI
ncbi:MAG: response regulator [Sulfurimonas sp.]|nr:response regulator [Sulfurimonas sp.]